MDVPRPRVLWKKRVGSALISIAGFEVPRMESASGKWKARRCGSPRARYSVE
jgi:hypothetical protein